MKKFWFNDNLINVNKANLSFLTHSLHYSGAVFEGERAYSGKIFKLEEHIIRLLNSAKFMYLDVHYTIENLIEAHKIFLSENNIKDAYIRPLIWRGNESLNIFNKSLSTNFMIVASKYDTLKYNKDITLCISKWIKPSVRSIPAQVKSSGHYNMLIVCRIEAEKLGYDDALLLDERGYIAECTTTNIFFINKDQLITPIADTFLNGITRQTIIFLAKNLGINVIEKHITIDQIFNYDDCFVTGTASEIKSVKTINVGNSIIKYSSSLVSNTLKSEYIKLVRNS